MPAAGVPMLLPRPSIGSPTRRGCSISADSAPRTQCGTRTSSPCTCSSPSFFISCRIQSSAASKLVEPAWRGPKVSHNLASRRKAKSVLVAAAISRSAGDPAAGNSFCAGAAMPPAIRTRLPAKNHPGMSVIFISIPTAVVAIDYATGCSGGKRILTGDFSMGASRYHHQATCQFPRPTKSERARERGFPPSDGGCVKMRPFCISGPIRAQGGIPGKVIEIALVAF